MAVSEVLWTHAFSRLFLNSGYFTTTIRDSLGIVSGDWPTGIEWDGTDTIWSHVTVNKIKKTSGKFTSTLKTSGAIAASAEGASEDGTDTYTSHAGAVDKLIKYSGKFSTTVKTSLDVSAVDDAAQAISRLGTDVDWAGTTDTKLYLQSGDLTSTMKTSLSVSAITSDPVGVSFDGTDTLWNDGLSAVANKLYKQSGHFTSTVKTSIEPKASQRIAESGHDDVTSRLAVAGGTILPQMMQHHGG